MNTMRRAFSPLLMFLLAACVLIGTTTALSQSELEKTLQQYNADAVQGYIQPVADLFGTNMHSGYYHTADVEAFGFHMSIDIVAMAAMVKDDQKTYTAKAPAGFNPASFQTATIFGGKGTEITDAATPVLRYKAHDGIFNTTYFPLAVPQLTIGNIYGTQATIRFITLPKIGDDKVPNVTLWGLGARHSISQYLPKVPVDLAAGIYYNSFKLGDMISSTGLAINAQASKSWSILTLYGGLQWENSSMNLSYSATDLTSPLVDITLDGANNFRFTAGLMLGLGPIKLFGDANFGSVTAISAGIGFGN